MPPLLDSRFGIQLATTNGATTKWQLATCRLRWQSVLVCFVWYPCMLALGRFLWLGVFLCAPFYAHSMAFRAVFFLCFVFYTPIILFVTPIESVTVQCLALPPTTYLDTSSSTTSTTGASSSTSTLPSSTLAAIEFSIGKARVQICSSSSLECWTPSDFGHWPICIRKHKKESCRNEKKSWKKAKKKKPEKTPNSWETTSWLACGACVASLIVQKDFTLFGSIRRRVGQVKLAKKSLRRVLASFSCKCAKIGSLLKATATVAAAAGHI